MSALAAINSVLRDPRIWRGHAGEQAVPAEPSGHAALDAILPHRGWTVGTLTEILFDADGIGELHLLLPTLAALTRQRRHTVLVAPPYLPYPQALLAAGVDLDHLHCVDAATDIEALWAVEQCLRSEVCAAVLCWPRQVNERSLRRLQVAAETGHALGFVFRASRAAANPSPAALRLQLRAHEETRLQVLKCRGASPPAHALVLRAAVSQNA